MGLTIEARMTIHINITNCVNRCACSELTFINKGSLQTKTRGVWGCLGVAWGVIGPSLGGAGGVLVSFKEL